MCCCEPGGCCSSARVRRPGAGGPGQGARAGAGAGSRVGQPGAGVGGRGSRLGGGMTVVLVWMLLFLPRRVADLGGRPCAAPAPALSTGGVCPMCVCAGLRCLAGVLGQGRLVVRDASGVPQPPARHSQTGMLWCCCCVKNSQEQRPLCSLPELCLSHSSFIDG